MIVMKFRLNCSSGPCSFIYLYIGPRCFCGFLFSPSNVACHIQIICKSERNESFEIQKPFIGCMKINI